MPPADLALTPTRDVGAIVACCRHVPGLLTGVTHTDDTSPHPAEHRSAPADAATLPWSPPVMVDGERHRVTAPDLHDDPTDFEVIEEAFAATGVGRSAPVGAGTGRSMRSEPTSPMRG